MDEARKHTKKFVRSIRTKSEYEAFMHGLMLTETEREIADMVFVKGWDYRLIGDTLGYSEVTIKRKMQKILDKLHII